MGHELIIYGMIEGVTGSSDDYRRFQRLNEEAIDTLPEKGDWSRLTRPMFKLPAEYPNGTYQTQIIHFGLSLKDGCPLDCSDGYDPLKNWRNPKRDSITGWIEDFENLLRKMFWYGACVHVHTDFEPDRQFSYVISSRSLGLMLDTRNPKPVVDWELTVVAT